MDGRVFIIASIIIFSGMLGGVGAFLADRHSQSPGRWEVALSRFIILGVIAAACVPLFLSLVQSALVRTIFGPAVNPGGDAIPPNHESYLIFVGLCLVAAFSSRKFLDSVSKQMFQRIEEVAGTAAQARKAAAEAKDTAAEATDNAADAKKVAQKVDEAAGEAADEPDAAPPQAAAEAAHSTEAPTQAQARRAAPITDEERRILLALKKRTYRTRTGVAEDSKISRNRISELLESMEQRKLALPTKSPTTGGQRWIITKRGEAALSASGSAARVPDRT